MPGTYRPVGPGSSVAPGAPQVGSRTDGLAPCTLTYYDPGLGGTNSSHGQADPHAATASGEPYDRTKFTCAAPPEFSFGTKLLITANGKSCTVKVNDRGGAIQTVGGVPHFDLSVAANNYLKHPSSGMYKRSNLDVGATTTGGDVISSVANSLNPLTDIAKIFSFLFSKQFLYVIGGGALFLVAIILVVHESSTGLTGTVSKAIRKVPPIE